MQIRSAPRQFALAIPDQLGSGGVPYKTPQPRLFGAPLARQAFAHRNAALRVTIHLASHFIFPATILLVESRKFTLKALIHILAPGQQNYIRPTSNLFVLANRVNSYRFAIIADAQLTPAHLNVPMAGCAGTYR